MTFNAKQKTQIAFKTVLDQWRSIIENGEAKAYAKQNPQFTNEEKLRNKEILLRRIEYLEEVLSQLKPYIYGLRGSISSIAEQTRICGIYLLFGSVISRWESIFLLEKNGKSYEAMELSRSIQEALDLIELFLSNGDSALSRWFDGQVIPNKESRSIFDKLLEHFPLPKGYAASQSKTYVYSVLSGYPHSAYPSVVSEMVSVFTHDLDKESVTGYYRALENSRNMKTLLGSTIVQLKSLFLYLKDPKTYDELDEIYRSISR